MREAELLKLVAADTPSHRGAWKRDSKAWQLFIRRQDERTSVPLIPEEEGVEDDGPSSGHGLRDDEDTEVNESEPSDERNKTSWNVPSGPSSLPIPIGPLHERPLVHSEKPIPSFPARRRFSTSDAFRRAAYAERDLSRSMDPGALDFDAEVEYENDDGPTKSREAGERGRQRALKILQARSKLPEEGMWRSLAT